MSYGRGVYGKAKYGIWSVEDSGAALSSASSAGATAAVVTAGTSALVSSSDLDALAAVLTAGVTGLSSVAVLTSDSTVENINGAQLASISALAATAERVQPYAAALVCQSDIEIAPSVLIFGAPDALTSVTVVGSNFVRVTSAPCALTALSSILADGRGIYVAIASEAESWTLPTPETTSWTAPSVGADSWQITAPVVNEWTLTPENAESWTETPVNG